MRAGYVVCAAATVVLFVAGLSAVFAENARDALTYLLEAYYFHGNFRCINCHNMERWTRETIESSFKKEIMSGKLVFQIINTDTKGNEHFMTDYQLYTKSVVLALIKDGKEVRYENLAKVWDHLRSEDGFCRYIKGEIERYLKEL
ncbi:MAG: nitrophenyl compound nitroreductase subunit ArsF family protein [Candidatus Omnitrophica bacterium]|nr:nitrophenyl compound nitroreductase subunit ArsF family protein [Candidatus Omnitrophota bacterium]